jgi:single-stranded DNA-binding protein
VSINTATIEGMLGREPESISENFTVLSLGVRVSNKDAAGNWVDRTLWVKVKTFGNDAKRALKLRKGDRCFASGRLDFEEWTVGEGDDEAKRTRTILLANTISSEGLFRPVTESPVEAVA